MTIDGYFEQTYGTKYAKIEYADIRDNGVPQQPYIIAFRDADDVQDVN